jgi:hypothetical protein
MHRSLSLSSFQTPHATGSVKVPHFAIYGNIALYLLRGFLAKKSRAHWSTGSALPDRSCCCNLLATLSKHGAGGLRRQPNSGTRTGK